MLRLTANLLLAFQTADFLTLQGSRRHPSSGFIEGRVILRREGDHSDEPVGFREEHSVRIYTLGYGDPLPPFDISGLPVSLYPLDRTNLTCTASTIMSMLKVGDCLTFSIGVDAGSSQVLRNAGLIRDLLVMNVHRVVKGETRDFKFVLEDTVTTPGSTARMVQFKEGPYAATK